VTTSNRSPGESRFTSADSKAPVPEAVKRRTSCVVRQTTLSRSITRVKSSLKSGPRWWITGAAAAASTSGGTGVGPGVNRYRLPGIGVSVVLPPETALVGGY
jgi:hypothetical protein